MSQSSPSVSLRSTDDAVYVEPKYATVKVSANGKKKVGGKSLSARGAPPASGLPAAKVKVEVLEPSPSASGSRATVIDTSIPKAEAATEFVNSALHIQDLESKGEEEDEKFPSEQSPSKVVLESLALDQSQSQVIVSVLDQSKVIERLPSPPQVMKKPVDNQIRHRAAASPRNPPAYAQPEPTPTRSPSGPANTEVISYNTDDTLKFTDGTRGLDNIRRMQDEEDKAYLAARGKRALSLIKEDSSKAGEGTNNSSTGGGTTIDFHRKSVVSPRLGLKDEKQTFFRKNAGWILGFGVILIIAVVVFLSLKTNVIVDHSSTSNSTSSGDLQIIDAGNSTQAPTSSPAAANTPSPTTVSPGTSTATPSMAPTTSAPVPAYSTPSCTLDSSSGMYLMKPVYGVKCFIRDDVLGTTQYLDGFTYSVDLNPPTQGNSFPVEIYGDYNDTTGVCTQYKQTITCN